MKDYLLEAVYFITVDISSGFHHIEVSKEDRHKTTFPTANVHFEWNRMPFGLRNAPIVFPQVIANLLQKHQLQKVSLNYLDNYYRLLKTYQEHLRTHLRQLFEMIKAEEIKLKLKNLKTKWSLLRVTWNWEIGSTYQSDNTTQCPG